MRVERHRGDGTVRHRYLPGAHHLIPRHHARNTAVANRNEETLRRYRREGQHPLK